MNGRSSKQVAMEATTPTAPIAKCNGGICKDGGGKHDGGGEEDYDGNERGGNDMMG